MTPRRVILGTLAGLLFTAPAYAACGGADAAQSECPAGAQAAPLKLNQLQLVGTAESYKQEPSAAWLSLIRMGSRKDAEALDFAQPSIPDQLDAGARALEFDIAFDPKGGLFKNPAGASMADEVLDPGFVATMSQPGFKVIHVLDVDFHSSCLTLKACLGEVAAWSRAHKNHLPLVIGLRTNDTKTPMPGATKPLPFDAAAFTDLDGEIAAVFHPDEFITPDQVQGAHGSLREAVTAGGWPQVSQARGKVIFVLDDCAAKVDLYAGPQKSLKGKPLFVTTDEASPLASFIAIDDPRQEGARIAAAIAQGFIVRTRADDQTREARANDVGRRDQAFASGAQIILTDFMAPDHRIGAYQVSIAGPLHALCDKRSAGAACPGGDNRVGNPGGNAGGNPEGNPPPALVTIASH